MPGTIPEDETANKETQEACASYHTLREGSACVRGAGKVCTYAQEGQPLRTSFDDGVDFLRPEDLSGVCCHSANCGKDHLAECQSWFHW